jgi:hypothetical protein
MWMFSVIECPYINVRVETWRLHPIGSEGLMQEYSNVGLKSLNFNKGICSQEQT